MSNTHRHIHLTALYPGLPRWAGTRKVKPVWISLKQETLSGSGISWAVCKSAPRSRQITTPAPNHSVFYRPDALPAAQPTASKHWRHSKYEQDWTILRGSSKKLNFVFRAITWLLPVTGSCLWLVCVCVQLVDRTLMPIDWRTRYSRRLVSISPRWSVMQPQQRPTLKRDQHRQRKCAENYDKWQSNISFLNCNQHSGSNFKP